MTQPRIETTIWELAGALYDEAVAMLGDTLEAQILSEFTLVELLDRATLIDSQVQVRAPMQRWRRTAPAEDVRAAV